MTITKRSAVKGFTQIFNSTLRDTRLTLEARGLICFIASLPDGWKIHKSWLMKENGIGRDKCSRILKELQEFGYMVKTAKRDEEETRGRVCGTAWEIWTESVKPSHTKAPAEELKTRTSAESTEELKTRTSDENHRATENPTVGKPTPINKDLKTNTDLSLSKTDSDFNVFTPSDVLNMTEPKPWAKQVAMMVGLKTDAAALANVWFKFTGNTAAKAGQWNETQLRALFQRFAANERGYMGNKPKQAALSQKPAFQTPSGVISQELAQSWGY